MSDPAVCMAALESALEIERKGLDLYARAAIDSTDKLAKEMFEYLAKEELNHIERIETIHKSINMTGNWCSIAQDPKPQDIKALFKNLAKDSAVKLGPDASEINAIETALVLEQKSRSFYEEQLKKSDDKLEKEFYTRMISEEQSHYVSLQDLKFYLTNPEAWFTEHEHHGLDGA